MDDAQCIAFATVVWPDSSHYAWVGDWGSECAGDDPSMGNWYCESTRALSDLVTLCGGSNWLTFEFSQQYYYPWDHPYGQETLLSMILIHD